MEISIDHTPEIRKKGYSLNQLPIALPECPDFAFSTIDAARSDIMLSIAVSIKKI